MAAFDDVGGLIGHTASIGDGSFHLPTEIGTGQVLNVWPDAYGFEDLTVRFIDVAGDMELDYPFNVYSSAGQLPTLPTITETGSMVVEEAQRLQFDAARLRGSSVEIRFFDGGTGWVDGVDTFVAPERGGLITTVPTGAQTGDVLLRVDGVDGPGYPLTVDPGLYLPGPFTLSGVVDDGASPIEGAWVGIFEPLCDDEFLVDYVVTGPTGAYSLSHGAGDYVLFVLPPASSGLVRGILPLPGLTGGQALNVTLSGGHEVSARCTDSGTGTVGSTDPLPDCEIGFVGVDVDHDEWVYSGDDGVMSMVLPTGSYEVFLHAPFGSRYISGEGTVLPITADEDFGDAGLDSGYFIEGRIEDPSGGGLAGVEVSAYDVDLGSEAGRTHSVGPDGNFRLAVPPGTYLLFTAVHPDHEYWTPSLFYFYVDQDLLFYPALQAEIAGHVKGSVVDTLSQPVDELPVAAYHDTLGFVRQTDTCADGSYDLKVPDGSYVIQARPSLDEICLADEYYDDHYQGCGADTVVLTAPATVSGIDFTLEPAGGISGTVIGSSGPLPDITVCAGNGLSNPVCYDGCTTTAPDGTFLLANVPVAADYRVEASGPGYAWECWDGYPDCTDYDPVTVAECVETGGIQFHTGAGSPPGPVPDGSHVAGTMMSVGHGASPGEIVITWQPTCDAEDHSIYFGTLQSFGSYSFAVCDAGVAGSRTLTPPAGNLFFVVVGQSGPLEGSYGVDGDLVERPHDGGAQCGNVQDLGATCVP